VLAAVFKPAQLLVDLNQAPIPVGSDVVHLCDSTVAGSFWGRDEARTLGLWASDGTPAGTRRIASFGSYTGSEYTDCLHSAGSLTFFQYTGQDGVSELWRTDGTGNGTFRLLRQPTRDDGPIYFLGHGTLYTFTANDGTHGNRAHGPRRTWPARVCWPTSTPGPDGSWLYYWTSIVDQQPDLVSGLQGNLWVSDFHDRRNATRVHEFSERSRVPRFSSTSLWPLPRRAVLFPFQQRQRRRTIRLYFSSGTVGGESARWADTCRPHRTRRPSVRSAGARRQRPCITVSTHARRENPALDHRTAPRRRTTASISGPGRRPGSRTLHRGGTHISSTAAPPTGATVDHYGPTRAPCCCGNSPSPVPPTPVSRGLCDDTKRACACFPADGTRPIWITDGRRPARARERARCRRRRRHVQPVRRGFHRRRLLVLWEGETLQLGQNHDLPALALSPHHRYARNRCSRGCRASTQPLGHVELGNRLLSRVDDPEWAARPGSAMARRGTAAAGDQGASSATNGSSDPESYPLVPGRRHRPVRRADHDGRRYLWRSDGNAPPARSA
jgi:hypothetical protein